MLELAFWLSMKYWIFIKLLNLAYHFIWSRLIPTENNEEKKTRHQNISPKILSQSPCKRQHIKSSYTINTTLFISAREIFISKAAKNGLMHARIFRAQTAMHFLFLKNITWKTAKLRTVSGKLLQCCYN